MRTYRLTKINLHFFSSLLYGCFIPLLAGFVTYSLHPHDDWPFLRELWGVSFIGFVLVPVIAKRLIKAKGKLVIEGEDISFKISALTIWKISARDITEVDLNQTQHKRRGVSWVDFILDLLINLLRRYPFPFPSYPDPMQIIKIGFTLRLTNKVIVFRHEMESYGSFLSDLKSLNHNIKVNNVSTSLSGESDYDQDILPNKRQRILTEIDYWVRGQNVIAIFWVLAISVLTVFALLLRH